MKPRSIRRLFLASSSAGLLSAVSPPAPAAADSPVSCDARATPPALSQPFTTWGTFRYELAPAAISRPSLDLATAPAASPASEPFAATGTRWACARCHCPPERRRSRRTTCVDAAYPTCACSSPAAG